MCNIYWNNGPLSTVLLCCCAMALVLGGGQIALADGPQARVGKSIPVSRVIGNKDLFKKSTPEETVNFIKYLARKKGLDLHEKEEKRRDHDSWDLNSDTARSLILGGQRKIVLAGDHSYIDRLNREISSGMDSGMEVGVFVADGSVSLADLIDVCSPGIRLFGRIPVSGPGIGLLVGGPRSAIIKLSELDFCFWIGPYKPDYKLNANDIHTGAINWTVGFWGSFDPDYEKELEACGAQIVTSGEGSFFIGASATWEQIQVIKNWWWVGNLMRPRPVEENSLENYKEAGIGKSPKKGYSDSTIELAAASRDLSGLLIDGSTGNDIVVGFFGKAMYATPSLYGKMVSDEIDEVADFADSVLPKKSKMNLNS